MNRHLIYLEIKYIFDNLLVFNNDNDYMKLYNYILNTKSNIVDDGINMNSEINNIKLHLYLDNKEYSVKEKINYVNKIFNYFNKFLNNLDDNKETKLVRLRFNLIQIEMISLNEYLLNKEENIKKVL